MLRAVGIKRDLRFLKNNQIGYNAFFLKSYISHNGDSYDRYIIRMLEMGESLNIINLISLKILKHLTKYKSYTNLTLTKLLYRNSDYTYTSMEDLIKHFIHWHTGFNINKNITSAYLESPKGEFGLTLESNNTTKPYKCKIRSPSYFNLQSISKLATGHYLGDISTLVGTIDIVFGEADR